jgi:hypothetical protein
MDNVAYYGPGAGRKEGEASPPGGCVAKRRSELGDPEYDMLLKLRFRHRSLDQSNKESID